MINKPPQIWAPWQVSNELRQRRGRFARAVAGLKKRILVIGAVILIAAFGVAAQEKPKGEAVAATNTAEAVRQLFDELVGSYAKNDAAVTGRVLADDFTFTNPFGEVMTREQRIAEIKPGGVHFDAYTVDDVNVRVFGDTAVVTNRASLTGKRGDQALSGQYRVTQVFVKRDGRWQLVAAQSTKIAQPATQ